MTTPEPDAPLYDADQMRAYAAAAVLAEQKDAARYRWLRDVGDESWEPLAKRGIPAAQIDAAIDSAIRGKPKEQQP